MPNKKRYEASLDNLGSVVVSETQDCAIAVHFISRVKFEDIVIIERNMTVWLHIISEEQFKMFFGEQKTSWDNCTECD